MEKNPECSEVRDFQTLYEEGEYSVKVNVFGTDGHYLIIKDVSLFLGRGMLYELARANSKKLESKLRTIGGESALGEIKNLDELGWFLAKAVIKDQEDYCEWLNNQK